MKNRRALALFVLLLFEVFVSQVFGQTKSSLKIVSYELSQTQPGFYNAVYLSKTGRNLRAKSLASDDGGRTWQQSATKTANIVSNNDDRLTPTTSLYDPNTNFYVTFLNVLDNGKNSVTRMMKEPTEGSKQYYLRYRVSADNGKTWLFEKPVFQDGAAYSQNKSFRGIIKGQNAIYVGDLGSVPIVTKSGKILLPTETTLSDNHGGLLNLGGGSSYMDVLVLNGTWNQDGTISWQASERVKGDPRQTTRGLMEPTITELNDGRILMVMRGSNEGKFNRGLNIPGYKWSSISSDGGLSWSQPAPMTYDDGTPFYSPSSMSVLFRHSSGRHFWVGNITSDNPRGNYPRYPLVMGEINESTGKLIRSSVITLDSIKPSDRDKGEVDISHVTMIEDRENKNIIITYTRNYGGYKSRDWVTTRISL